MVSNTIPIYIFLVTEVAKQLSPKCYCQAKMLQAAGITEVTQGSPCCVTHSWTEAHTQPCPAGRAGCCPVGNPRVPEADGKQHQHLTC